MFKCRERCTSMDIPPFPRPPPQIQQKNLGFCVYFFYWISFTCIWKACKRTCRYEPKNASRKAYHTSLDCSHWEGHVNMHATAVGNQILIPHQTLLTFYCEDLFPCLRPKVNCWPEFGVAIIIRAGLAPLICCRGRYIHARVRNYVVKDEEIFSKALALID